MIPVEAPCQDKMSRTTKWHYVVRVGTIGNVAWSFIWITHGLERDM